MLKAPSTSKPTKRPMAEMLRPSKMAYSGLTVLALVLIDLVARME
jgi:hypothetical protein